jgi:hypothetical protein
LEILQNISYLLGVWLASGKAELFLAYVAEYFLQYFIYSKFIIFEENPQFIGKLIPICPSVDRLFPTISLFENAPTFEDNFGNDKDKPFQYDIQNCPGMELDCI